MKNHILSIQSDVSYGFAGNSISSFIIQRLGIRFTHLNTVRFTNHTGYGKSFGKITETTELKTLFDGLSEMNFLSTVNCIISGYIGSYNNGKLLTEIEQKIISNNENAIILVDPVMGDTHRGFFVKDEIIKYFTEDALRFSNFITPNAFEAEHLSGIKINSLKDAMICAKTIFNNAKKINDRKFVVIIKSIMDKPNKIVNLVYDGLETLTITTPFIDFKNKKQPGALGDMFAAIFIGSYMINKNIKEAFEKATNISYLVIKDTYESSLEELSIIENQKLFELDKFAFSTNKK